MTEDDYSQLYMVRLLPRALAEIDRIAEQFEELAGSEIEDEWRMGLGRVITGLSENPRRYPLIPEHRYFTQEVRHIVFRRRPSSVAYRVLFTVADSGQDGPLVRVFHLRHSAARPLGRKAAQEIESAKE